MRLSLAAASLATSVVLLAGCSNSSQATLPIGASQGATQNVGRGLADFQMLPKVITREQASKVHLTTLPRQVLEKDFRRQRPSHIKVDKSATPSMVIADFGGYIWWVTKTGVITGYATDCQEAEGATVDRHGRLIVACVRTGTINIYNKGNVTGPADVVLNDVSGFSPGAAFEDKSGNIFATNLGGMTCGQYTCTTYPGDIVWWTTNNQSTGSTPSGSYTDTNLWSDYYADVDANGNVYVDGFHCTGMGQYGCYYAAPEVDMITNIMGSSPSATDDNVTLIYPGGVNVLKNGQISVLDQGCNGYDSECAGRALYLYNALPGTPAATLTPPQNLLNFCDPVAGGYNKGDKEILIGDAGCKAGQIGKVKSNGWRSILNIDFYAPAGAAYLKSDK